MSLITLLTPTGSRQEAFTLVEKYIGRQTLLKDHDLDWIVVDDSPHKPTQITMNQRYFTGPLKYLNSKMNTQRYSMDFALSKVKPESEYLFIIEDDDWLAPNYLEVYMSLLEQAPLVGEGNVTYYNIGMRSFMELNNFQTASACQTAFRKSYTPHIYNAIHGGEKYWDITIWGNAKAAKHKHLLFTGLHLAVGIKGIGRHGIGVGHQDTSPFTPDPQFVKLKQLVGEEDAKVYIEMCKK